VYIAVERYFAIIHPLRQRGRFTRRRLKVFVVIGWIFALLINIPDVLRVKSYHTARVVQKVDNAIHRINHYPADSAVCFVDTYPLDSDLSCG